ncbi:DNA repair protein complementing XP-A cells homolog [Anopheles ziemanni]|uniref:DNA repair protein complementing XP-A cells homolog n=1 Tax=Anopheles coustani TaxID=139045 RepID=UPI0026590FA8|nr:DNA repair protein complementing XP-A cells homolog [Anopheles coustani]XP_058166796.1 DNA repair protein complementing XP-A cells homolog [Anopheles ziemanni]
MSDVPSKSTKTQDLSDYQRHRIEENRQKAISLRQARLLTHPYNADKKQETAVSVNNVIKVSGTKYVDSGGGFLIEQRTHPTEEVPEEEPTPESDAVPVPIEYEECLECGDRFADSYLLNTFEYAVCDACRDPDGQHSLITRTEAKQEYLLKDCDLDRREPALKYISRKNPHNVRWGEMKLYLHLQIEKRALEVWGSEENLMREKEQREEKREVAKVKKYNKRLKVLRMDVRSSLYDKTVQAHVHSYGESEVYNEADDTYTRTCEECGHTETYEKM